MNKFFMVLAIVALSFGCQKKGATKPKEIGEGVQVFDKQQLIDFVASQKLSDEQILESIATLKNSFKNSYVGYDFKKSLIGKSGNQIFHNCEGLVYNSEKSEFNSIEYHDIMKQCVAQWKDSHMSLQTGMLLPRVATGISSAEILNDRVYISGVRPVLLKKLEEMQGLEAGSLVNSVQLGAEIVEVDGLPVLQAARELSKYVSSSSDADRMKSAVVYLFKRNFSYPNSSELRLQLKTSAGETKDVTLTWVQAVSDQATNSLDAKVILNNAGIKRIGEISDDTSILSTNIKDFQSELYSGLKIKKSYTDNEDSTVLTTGYIVRNEKNYCYASLNTFNLEDDDDFSFKIYEKVGTQKVPHSLLAVFGQFLETCEFYKTSLILDLRNNPGGNAALVTALYNMIDQGGKARLYKAESLLINKGNLSLNMLMLNDLDKAQHSIRKDLYYQAITEAIQAKAGNTSWVLLRNKIPNEDSSSPLFSQKILTLVSTDCVSACETFSNNLKKTGRALVVGTPTNGTGFGFRSMGSAETSFRDPLNFFTISIPNYAFQATVVEDDSQFLQDDKLKGSVVSLDSIPLMENRPVQPDIKLEYQLSDLMNGYNSYIQKLDEILEDVLK